jgi:hypothetical protein
MTKLNLNSEYGIRLRNMQEAAHRIIDSTTIADWIAIILFNETTITVIDDQMVGGSEYNKKSLNEKVANLKGPSINTTDKNTPNRTAVYERALEVSKDGQCSTAILLFTNDIKNTNDALKEMDIQFQQHESSTGKSILNFIFLTDNGDVDPNAFNCTGNTFRTGIWSTIVKEDIVTKALSVYFDVFQAAFEELSKLSSSTATDDKIAWVEVYQFYERGVNGTTVSAPIYDDTGRLLGVVGIDNTVQAINLLSGSPVDTIEEEIGIKAGEKGSTDRCFNNFTSLSPCNFNFALNNKTNTVLCNTTQSTNSSNECLINQTIATGINSTTNSNSDAERCCNNGLIGVTCSVIDKTSQLWQNVDNDGKNYTARVCSSSQTTNLSGAAIAGYVVGGLAITTLCIVGAMFFYRRYQQEATRTIPDIPMPKRSRPPPRPPRYDE